MPALLPEDAYLPEPLARLTDRFLHDGPMTPSARRDARVAVLIAGQSTLAMLLFAVLWTLVLPPVALPVFLAGLVTPLTLLRVRSGHPAQTAHLCAAIAWAVTTIVVWRTGGSHSPALGLLVMPPVLTAALRLPLGIAAWSVASLVTPYVLARLEAAGWTPHAVEPAARVHVAALLIGFITTGVLAVVAQLAVFSERTNQRLGALNRELEEARDRADAASEAKSAFLAAMSHEIRTPMNGVLGMAGLLLKSPLEHAQRDQVETIHQSANALVEIVEDILDFSRIEAGRFRLEEAPFEPVAIVRQVADLLRVRAREKGLRLEVELGPRLPGRVLGDGGRLRQVLFNLVGNAVKYTDQGTVTVHVTAAPIASDRSRLQVVVRDTGIGIAPEDLARIWDRFTQVHDGVQRRAAGTGLGLAISRRLVDLMGGTVSAESTVGEGSAFTLSVELRVATQSDDDTAPQDITLPPLPAARVLVAEDNPVNRKVTLAMLDHLGLVGDAVANGELAVSMARLHRYDVILMDCEMPVADGYQASRQLRRDGFRTPILAMTAHAPAEVSQRCAAAGMDDHLQKPVRLEVLHRALARWLQADA